MVNSEIMWLFAQSTTVGIIAIFAPLLIMCGKGATQKGGAKKTNSTATVPSNDSINVNSALKSDHAGDHKNLPGGVAATCDPNYQTLAGVGDDCFNKNPPPSPGASPGGPPKAPVAPVAPINTPKAPAVGGVAATHDPNYQTLAGIGGDCFADKGAGGGAAPGKGAPAGGGAPPAPPKPPAAGGVAATHDPNYQTLAGIGGDCFGADKKGGGGGAGGGPAPPKPPAAGGVAATHDPNYQTLAGIGGDCFGADKKR